MANCKGCIAGSTVDKPCEFQNNYAQGSSIKGFYVEDVIAVVDDPNQSPAEGVRATFGCITNETHHFLTQSADGILGLSPNRQSNLLEKIYEEHGKLTAEQLEFGICMAIDGGQFSIGNINNDLHDPNKPPVPVKLRSPTNSLLKNLQSFVGGSAQRFYSLDIQQMFIGKRSLEISASSLQGEGVFVDSGATYTYLPSYQYNLVIEELDKVCKTFSCVLARGESNRCYHFKDKSKSVESEVARFPNLIITLPNTNNTLDWTPQSYFMVRNDTARELCVGIESIGRMILGANWMTNRDIYFDLSESRLLMYQSIGCLPFNSSKTLHDRTAASPIRMMYESMLPSLLDSDFQDFSVDWMWMVMLLGILAIVFILAILLVCFLKTNDSQEQAVRSNAIKGQTDNEQFDETLGVHTTSEITEAQGQHQSDSNATLS